MVDAVDISLLRWVEGRPSPEEITQAISQIQDLIIFAQVHGMYQGNPALEAVICWLFVSGQIPLDWLEARLTLGDLRDP